LFTRRWVAVKGKGIPVIAGALAFTAAVGWAGPGSVISSFRAFSGDIPTGAYRDADYVYVISVAPPWAYAIKCTPTGSYVGVIDFPGLYWVPEDPDHSYLGSSYITIAVELGVQTFPKTGGPYVRWDHRELDETLGYAHLPGSPYYYVGVALYKDDEYIVYRFSTQGSLISSFVPEFGGKLAATDRFAGAPGEYLIGSGSPCGVYEPGGSLVATFTHQAGRSLYGGTAGPGYPASWGTTLWALSPWPLPGEVYQIDLGNGNSSAITPASLGKVKALFR
jgi:hypothetical protein